MAPKQTTTASERAMAGTRRNRIGIKGSFARRSHQPNSTNPSTAAAASVRSVGDIQASRRPPDVSTNKSVGVATQNSSAPAISGRNRARAGIGVSGMRSASSAAARPSGRLMKKTARQLMCSVRYAPRSCSRAQTPSRNTRRSGRARAATRARR